MIALGPNLTPMGRALLFAQASLSGSNDGLGAVGYLEFAEDGGDVVGDGFEAEDQPVGNVAVVVALGDDFEDFALAIGEFGEDLGHHGGLGGGEEVDEAMGSVGARLHFDGSPASGQRRSPAHTRSVGEVLWIAT